MFCRKCGAQIEDNDAFCPYCGESTQSAPQNQPQIQPSNNNANNASNNESKSVIGVIMAFFLGILGLVIGVLMYPADTVARKTFVKAWAITWLVFIVVTVFMSMVFIFDSVMYF